MEISIKQFKELSVDELHAIYKLRVSVFVVEQNCPYQEVDDLDINSYHVMLKENDEIVAYCRVIDSNNPFHEVSIGRVISTVRRKGYGSKAVEQGILVAKEKYHANRIVLEAQTYAKQLYKNLRFVETGEPFLEDGIEHIKMILEI